MSHNHKFDDDDIREAVGWLLDCAGYCPEGALQLLSQCQKSLAEIVIESDGSTDTLITQSEMLCADWEVIH